MVARIHIIKSSSIGEKESSGKKLKEDDLILIPVIKFEIEMIDGYDIVTSSVSREPYVVTLKYTSLIIISNRRQKNKSK
jgi:hypothetical protein